LPAGESTIELVYGPDGWDVAGATLSGLVLAALGGWAWRGRRGPQGRSVAEIPAKLDLSRS
jgi:hypothetical protein